MTTDEIYDEIDARLQKTGGAAFPLSRRGPADEEGMDLRDWFAGQALIGILASTAHPNSNGPNSCPTNVLAHECFKIADAMIAERKAGA